MHTRGNAACCDDMVCPCSKFDIQCISKYHMYFVCILLLRSTFVEGICQFQEMLQ